MFSYSRLTTHNSRLFISPTFPHLSTSLRRTLVHPYLYSTIMSKPLTQITFDFSADDNSIRIAEERLLSTPRPPAEVYEQNPEPEIKTEVTIIEESSVEELAEEPVVEEIQKRRSPRGRLSLKEIHVNADLIQIPPDEILFQKQYYSIGEVSKWFRVNQSLIRYWETEFDILEPRKNRKGDRFFRPVDVKNLVLIHDLLRRRKFTIEGAKEFLKKNKKGEEKFAMIQSLEKIKSFLNELKASLG
jgi:DNA-binding transcriptional MerR regulator